MRTEWAPEHIAIEPRGTQSLATLFLARAASAAKDSTRYSFELEAATGNPLIVTEAFTKTLTDMQSLSPQLAVESQSSSFNDCWNIMLSGRAAIGIAMPVVVPAMASDDSSSAGESGEVTEHIQFSPLPGSSELFNADAQVWAAPNDGQR